MNGESNGESAGPPADFTGGMEDSAEGMNSAGNMDSAEALAALVRRRVESRYRRILFVHRELAKLDGAVPVEGSGSFEDFVFSRIDFSVYKKIDAEEFSLLFDEGLDDYDEPFYRKAFGLNREEVRRTITRSYIRVGPFYVCKNAGPLLLSIMRTLHTSLEFAPLLRGADVNAAASASDEQVRTVAAALDGIVIRHGDGAETRLFTHKTTPGVSLRAVFCPLGKAFTVTLVP